MAAITATQYHEAYELARQLCETSLSRREAERILVERTGINPTSASAYIYTLAAILNGQTYKRTINNDAVAYVLDRIEKDYDAQRLATAVEAFSRHVDYYEGTGNRVPALRALVESYSSRSANTVAQLDADLEQAVSASLRKSRMQRLEDIEAAARYPKSELRLIRYFLRNPDIRAEALVRAGGICQRCHAVAPFLRSSDASPYLEVHHRLPLSEGGEDTLENSVALCPNCHREAHHGQLKHRYRT